MSALVGLLWVMRVSAHFDDTFDELCEIASDRPTRRGFVDVLSPSFLGLIAYS